MVQHAAFDLDFCCQTVEEFLHTLGRDRTITVQQGNARYQGIDSHYPGS